MTDAADVAYTVLPAEEAPAEASEAGPQFAPSRLGESNRDTSSFRGLVFADLVWEDGPSRLLSFLLLVAALRSWLLYLFLAASQLSIACEPRNGVPATSSRLTAYLGVATLLYLPLAGLAAHSPSWNSPRLLPVALVAGVAHFGAFAAFQLRPCAAWLTSERRRITDVSSIGGSIFAVLDVLLYVGILACLAQLCFRFRAEVRRGGRLCPLVADPRTYVPPAPAAMGRRALALLGPFRRFERALSVAPLRHNAAVFGSLLLLLIGTIAICVLTAVLRRLADKKLDAAQRSADDSQQHAVDAIRRFGACAAPLVSQQLFSRYGGDDDAPPPPPPDDPFDADALVALLADLIPVARILAHSVLTALAWAAVLALVTLCVSFWSCYELLLADHDLIVARWPIQPLVPADDSYSPPSAVAVEPGTATAEATASPPLLAPLLSALGNATLAGRLPDGTLDIVGSFSLLDASPYAVSLFLNAMFSFAGLLLCLWLLSFLLICPYTRKKTVLVLFTQPALAVAGKVLGRVCCLVVVRGNLIRAPRLLALVDLVYTFTIGALLGISSACGRYILGSLHLFCKLIIFQAPILPERLAVFDGGFGCYGSATKARHARLLSEVGVVSLPQTFVLRQPGGFTGV